MNILEAIILGIIQGLTEFLPISSTGHLTVAGKLLGLINNSSPERWTSFIAVIQLGTMLSVLIYFWKDIWSIFFGFIKENFVSRKRFSEQNHNSKLGWLIIIGTIPIVIIGLVFKDFIEGVFTKDLYIIASSLILLAVFLFIAEKTAGLKKDLKNITWIDSLIIGFAQSIALIPGSSRSGTTITAGLFMGLKRETAARFSFLLSVPAVLGSGLLQFYESMEYLDASLALNIFIATAVSAVSGYLAIDFLLKYLKRHSTYLFIFYRIALGLLILLLIFSNIIQS